jgi:hypothetical protein
MNDPRENDEKHGSAGVVTSLACAGVGLFYGLICSGFILLPLGQALIDSDNDDVVLWTIRYFRWAAGAFLLGCGVIGAAVGFTMARCSAGSTNERQRR